MEINRSEILTEEVVKQLRKEFKKRPWYSSQMDLDLDAFGKINTNKGKEYVPLDEVLYVMNEYMVQLPKVIQYKNDFSKIVGGIHLCPIADEMVKGWKVIQFLKLLEKHMFFEDTGEGFLWDFFHDYIGKGGDLFHFPFRVHGFRRLFPYCRYADSRRIIKVIERADKAITAKLDKVCSVQTIYCALLLSDTQEAIDYLDKKKLLGYYASIRGKTEEQIRNPENVHLDDRASFDFDLT